MTTMNKSVPTRTAAIPRGQRAPDDVALHGVVSREVHAWVKARAARNRHSLSREVWGLLQEVFEREQQRELMPTSVVQVPGGFHTDAPSVPR